ncbi:MAG: hypothetical protein RR911_05415 [Oscillospiraceae bacterium]
MNKSKFLALILSLIMALSLAACGGQDKEATTKPSTKKATTTTTTTPAAPEAKVVEVKDAKLPNFTIKINDKQYTNKDFATLTVYSAESTSVNKSGTEIKATYVGYKIKDICDLLKLDFSNGIDAVASDGYKMPYDKKIVKADSTLLGITKDGSADKGLFVSPCAETVANQYSKMVTTITVK